MEPISAMSSVVGIIGIAGQLTSYLSNFITTANRASALAQHAFSEITNLSMMFSQLQGFLANQQPSQSRAMITVDELVVILTGCSVIFLELEKELRGPSNSKEMGVWEAVKWAMKESTLKRYSTNLASIKRHLIFY
ncbi:hypothetical protein FPQ18DRAFT_402832 [Pyronema domesticum]|uniref:Fungal N-terminal domain-containing protein n=1 Tax=Pyronema omphalodes (strain CBS 100304) TaxID=1076935 RepID=U4LPM1_PYROM|nr:hypothetical protein FPQ18DRAFT_402832 [Pyronema domesticum]CCX33885.1 Similar to hypothetical protein FG01800.1 [Gibberella zeae PH-1]; acc. no. XP_381976 [Pyronema omphalodes CBS 100304]